MKKIDPRILYLYIANGRCNMKCGYCCLRFETTNKENYVEHDQPVFCPGLVDKALEGKPKNFSGIQIWGGEPLYNFDIFKQVVEYCRERWPKTHLSIITNGTMFGSDEITDFLIKHNVVCYMSHDGYAQSSRGQDYLLSEKHVKNIKRLNYIHFHVLIHKHSLDMHKMLDYWKSVRETHGFKNMVITFHELKASDQASYEYLPSGNELGFMAKELDYLIEQTFSGDPMFSHYMNSINSMMQRYEGSIHTGNCGEGGTLTITTTGEERFCTNEAAMTEPIAFDPSEGMPDMCKDCSVLTACRGCCACVPASYRKKNCSYAITYFTSIIDSIKKMSNKIMLDSEGNKQ